MDVDWFDPQGAEPVSFYLSELAHPRFCAIIYNRDSVREDIPQFAPNSPSY